MKHQKPPSGHSALEATETATELAHDLSVSGFPQAESIGRMLKAITPPLMAWVDGEAKRSDRPGVERMANAINAVANMVVTVAVTVTMKIVNGNPDAELLRAVKACVNSSFDASIRDAEKAKVRP